MANAEPSLMPLSSSNSAYSGLLFDGVLLNFSDHHKQNREEVGFRGGGVQGLFMRQRSKHKGKGIMHYA